MVTSGLRTNKAQIRTPLEPIADQNSMVTSGLSTNEAQIRTPPEIPRTSHQYGNEWFKKK